MNSDVCLFVCFDASFEDNAIVVAFNNLHRKGLKIFVFPQKKMKKIVLGNSKVVLSLVGLNTSYVAKFNLRKGLQIPHPHSHT